MNNKVKEKITFPGRYFSPHICTYCWKPGIIQAFSFILQPWSPLGSSVIFRTVSAMGDRVIYKISADKAGVKMNVQWLNSSGKSLKITTGEVEPARYVSLQEFLEDYVGKKAEKGEGDLEIITGSKWMEANLSDAQKMILGQKFEEFLETFCSDDEYTDIIQILQWKPSREKSIKEEHFLLRLKSWAYF